mgnify:CR=1 FL=1
MRLVLNGDTEPVNLPTGLRTLVLGYYFNQRLRNLPSSLRYLTLGAHFNQKLENLPTGLRSLTFLGSYGQKLKNLPTSLQSLHILCWLNQKLDFCIALPNLKILVVNIDYEQEVPPLLNTTVIYFSDGSTVKETYENYKNYGITEWKYVFYKSISINKIQF